MSKDQIVIEIPTQIKKSMSAEHCEELISIYKDILMNVINSGNRESTTTSKNFGKEAITNA